MKKILFVALLLIFQFGLKSAVINENKADFVKETFSRVSIFLKNETESPVLIPDVVSMDASGLSLDLLKNCGMKNDAAFIKLLKSIKETNFFKPVNGEKRLRFKFKKGEMFPSVLFSGVNLKQNVTPSSNFTYWFGNCLKYSPVYQKDKKLYLVVSSAKFGLFIEKNEVVAVEDNTKAEGADFDYFFLSVMDVETQKVSVYVFTIGDRCRLLKDFPRKKFKKKVCSVENSPEFESESVRQKDLLQKELSDRYLFFAKVVPRLRDLNCVIKDFYVGKELPFVLSELNFKKYKVKFFEKGGWSPFYAFFDREKERMLFLYVENKNSTVCTGIELLDLKTKNYELVGITDAEISFNGSRVCFKRVVYSNFFEEIKTPVCFERCVFFIPEAAYSLYEIQKSKNRMDN